MLHISDISCLLSNLIQHCSCFMFGFLATGHVVVVGGSELPSQGIEPTPSTLEGAVLNHCSTGEIAKQALLTRTTQGHPGARDR